MKSKSLTPFDQGIVSFATEFSKIPVYENMMKDEDLKKLHTFMAVGMMGIHDAANMVVGSFIPAANKVVVNTRAQIQRSQFKDILTGLDYDPNITQYETIRLGYVFVFHKFEVFVNQLMEMMDGAMNEVSTPLKKYAKLKFDFNNSAYSIPKEFDQHSKNEKIVRNTQQFRADIKGLTDALRPLVQAITGIFLTRAIEAATASLLEGPIDVLQKTQLETANIIQESTTRIKISSYQQ